MGLAFESIIWIKKVYPHLRGQASSSQWKAQIEQKGRKGMHSLPFFLSWDIHFLPPLGIGAPGSQATGLGSYLHQWTPSHAFHLELGVTLSSPGSQALWDAD